MRTWAIEKRRNLGRFANTITHFTNVQSIHNGFCKWNTMDDNPKKFIPQMAIDTKFFHSTFVNPCMM
jgi:hypothetical protein